VKYNLSYGFPTALLHIPSRLLAKAAFFFCYKVKVFKHTAKYFFVGILLFGQ